MSLPEDPRDVGSDVRRQPTGQRPFPSATVTSAQKRSAVVPRHEDGKSCVHTLFTSWGLCDPSGLCDSWVYVTLQVYVTPGFM
ncbi:hypothetical protein ACI65C_006363 [Semiaphis heraclei]